MLFVTRFAKIPRKTTVVAGNSLAEKASMTPTPSSLKRTLAVGSWLLAVALIGGYGCSGLISSDDEGAGGTTACLTNDDYFAREVWVPVVSKECLSCHMEGAVAGSSGLALQGDGMPGFLAHNQQQVTKYFEQTPERNNILIEKALGRAEHGGGAIIGGDSPELQVLLNFAERLKEPVTCKNAYGVDPSHLLLQSPGETLYRASLQLTGDLPPTAELKSLSNEEDLVAQLDELLSSDQFLETVKLWFNDLLLTDKYRSEALGNRIGYSFGIEFNDDFPSDQRNRINGAIAREPLDIIAHTVANDLPLTSILTADYTVLTPDSAEFFKPELNFDGGATMATTTLTQSFGEEAPQVPHAGILSTPPFLHRYPTTPSNRNRHRSRMVYQMFLATDIFEIADRPADPSSSDEFETPTMEDPQCSICHDIVDGPAGAFQSFDRNNQERVTRRDWHDDMVAPGFEEESVPGAREGSELRWLGQQIVQDPRFAYAMTRLAVEVLLGRDPLPPVTDTNDPDFTAKSAAWQHQSMWLGELSEKFIASNYNFKGLVKEIILSPYYRATGIADDVTDPAPYLAFSTLPTGRPEYLEEKTFATTGVRWRKGNAFSGDYAILLGGIDSDDVTRRVRDASTLQAAAIERMSYELSCDAVPFDFTLARDARKMFPSIDATSTDQAAVQATASHLITRLLGVMNPDPVEVDELVTLFMEVQKEGAQAVSDGDESAGLGNCAARRDPTTGDDLPEERRLQDDDNYTVRAWISVMSYLLTDPRFYTE